MTRRRRKVRRNLWLLFAAALCIRLLFVAAVLEAQAPPELRRMNGDSREYLRLADHLATTGRYTPEDDVDLAVVSLVRTPAYPVVVAGFLKAESLLGLTPTVDQTGWHWARTGPGGEWALGGLFVLQAVGDALLCVLAALIAMRLWRRPIAGYVAGGLMALCPTGWGLSAVVLTDGWFALFVGVSAWLTLRAARSPRRGPALLAGVSWLTAALTKPTLLFWPLALPLFWWLSTEAEPASAGGEQPTIPRPLKRARPHNWRSRTLANLAICWLILVSGLLAWCSYNWQTKGVFTLSIVSERNLRFMYGPKIEVWDKLGRDAPQEVIQERYYDMGHQDLRWIAEPGMTPAEFVRRQREYIGLLLPLRPDLMARLYLRNLESNLVGSWDIFVNQLPPKNGEPIDVGGMGTGGRFTPLARGIFGPFFVAEGFKPLRWLLAALAVFAPIVALLRRRRLGPVLAIWLLCLYLLLTAATTGGQGSRILYPAYAPATALLAGWATLVRPRNQLPSRE